MIYRPKKPPFTYTELIEYALEDKGELTVSGIYQWISWVFFKFYQSGFLNWCEIFKVSARLLHYFFLPKTDIMTIRHLIVSMREFSTKIFNDFRPEKHSPWFSWYKNYKTSIDGKSIGKWFFQHFTSIGDADILFCTIMKTIFQFNFVPLFEWMTEMWIFGGTWFFLTKCNCAYFNLNWIWKTWKLIVFGWVLKFILNWCSLLQILGKFWWNFLQTW